MATNTPGHVARQLPEQEVHYLRLGFAYNTPGIAAGIPFAAYIPQGAQILRTNVIITTAFNAGTTNVITIGDNASTYNDMVQSGDVTATAVGLTSQTRGATGTAATNLAAGDVRPYLTYTQTGGAATAGAGVAVIEYVPNNDL